MSALPNPLLVLVAGPFRSGTDDGLDLIARNMAAMNAAALAVFRAGHLPITGEWFTLPLIETAGSTSLGNPIWDAIFHPVAERIAARCDACLRVGGPSAGADAMVALFERDRRPVFRALAELSPVGGGRRS